MLTCTKCSSHLNEASLKQEVVVCKNCSSSYKRIKGFISFIEQKDISSTYGGMEDDKDLLDHEDLRTRERFRRYFVPLLKKMKFNEKSKILCLGCGGGADVEELLRSGFPRTYGVDIGWRVGWWAKRRQSTEHYFIADGEALPFKDGVFDAVIALGVMEHIGAVGATSQLKEDYQDRRKRFIRESLRVTTKTGTVILSCPNRSFPVDFHHNISRTKLFQFIGHKWGISFHSPFNKFLWSYRDVKNTVGLFEKKCAFNPLKLQGYIGFNLRNSRWLKPVSLILKLTLLMLDQLPDFIRESFLNPYLLVSIIKKKEKNE